MSVLSDFHYSHKEATVRKGKMNFKEPNPLVWEEVQQVVDERALVETRTALVILSKLILIAYKKDSCSWVWADRYK